LEGGVTDLDADDDDVTAVAEDVNVAGIVELVDTFLPILTVVADEEHIEELDELDDKNDEDEALAFGPPLPTHISLLFVFAFKTFMANEPTLDASSQLFSLIVILVPQVVGDGCCCCCCCCC
jgi:hypothetical protein